MPTGKGEKGRPPQPPPKKPPKPQPRKK